MDAGQVVQIVVQWVHVLAGILWLGGTVLFSLLVLPTIDVLPPVQQRRFGRALVPRLSRYFSIVAGVTMLMGLIRGRVSWVPSRGWTRCSPPRTAGPG